MVSSKMIAKENKLSTIEAEVANIAKALNDKKTYSYQCNI